MYAWCEAVSAECVPEQRGVGELAGSYCGVGVGCVLGDCEFGVGSVEIHRLRTDEDQRVEVRFKCVQRVEHCCAGSHVERVNVARHVRCPSSR